MAPPPPPPARLPASLMDEIVEEFFLRIPPDDPSSLLRAALVCKCWCRIISDPGFHRRFREFHRTPPMLGFLSNFRTFSCFVPTTSFLPPFADGGSCSYMATAIDARHGRVLLHAAPLYLNQNPTDSALVVWDPIRGERTELPSLPRRPYHPHTWNAALLCASSLGGACDHLHCRRGHFLVVFMGFDREQRGMFSYVYSSEAAAWSEPAYYGQHPGAGAIGSVASALVRNALYFMLRDRKSVIEYDLGAREVSLIDLPAECSVGGNVLMTTDEGGLGLANLVRNRLCLWSWEAAGPDRDAGWVRIRAMDLRALLPDEALSTSLHVAGFACGIAAIFLRTRVGIFTVDLKSCQVAKVYEDGGCFDNFPYISFYTPELRVASAKGPRMGTLNP